MADVVLGAGDGPCDLRSTNASMSHKSALFPDRIFAIFGRYPQLIYAGAENALTEFAFSQLRSP